MGEKKLMRKIHEKGSESEGDTPLDPEYEVWKPDRMNPILSTLNDEDKKTFYLFRNVTSILNKLTPENFTKLLEKMKNLPIDTSARMLGVVDIIHKKAINEYKFCGLYAKLCNILQDSTVVNEEGIVKSFSVFLISHCEKYFENSLVDDFKFDRTKARINLCLDLKKKRELLQEYELDEYMFRKQSAGNCRFIGELFKLYMINPKIIFLMLDKFFKQEGIMSLECSCELITTIGKFYEEKFGAMPQLYFESIETLTQRIDLLSRIRFLLQDVLDLKKNSWHRRIQPEIPKTFEQIEQEIREEENKIKLALAIYPRKPKDNKNAIYRNNNSSSWTKLSTKFDKTVYIQKALEKKEASMVSMSSQPSAISQENASCDSSSSTQSSKTTSKRWFKPKDLQKVCQRLFDDYVHHGDLNAAVNSFTDQFVTNQIPKVIFALIKYVVEDASQNAGKCGELLAGLLEHAVISTQNVVKGLSLFLSAGNDQHISGNLELILGPLFLGNYLELDDLTAIFEENRSTKSSVSKTKRNQTETKTNFPEHIGTFPKKQENNDGLEITKNGDEGCPKEEASDVGGSNLNESNESDKNKKSTLGNKPGSLPTHPVEKSDSCSCASIPATNAQFTEDIHLAKQSSKNENCGSANDFGLFIRPASRSFGLIYDLFTSLTPTTYVDHSSKLKTFPFKRSDQLKYAAFCIMQLVFERPDWYRFYARVCVVIRCVSAEGMEFQIILINQCQRYFEMMYGEEPYSSSGPEESEINVTAGDEKQNVFTFCQNEMFALCRFIAELCNLRLLTCKTVFKCLTKLSSINDLESFCEICEIADLSLERERLSSLILNLLADDNLNASIRRRLQNIAHTIPEEKFSRRCNETSPNLVKKQTIIVTGQTLDPLQSSSFKSNLCCSSVSPTSSNVIENTAAQCGLMKLSGDLSTSPRIEAVSHLVSYAEHIKLVKEVEKLRLLEEKNQKKLQEQAQKLVQLNELIEDLKGLKK